MFMMKSNYNANCEAHKIVAADLGLGNDRLANTIHACNKICKADINRRKCMNADDKTTDILGAVQHSSFHNGKPCDLHVENNI